MGERDAQKTVLLCVTGCIAAYKSCEIVRLLQKQSIRVKVLMTEHAMQFVGLTTFRALTHEKVALGLFDDLLYLDHQGDFFDQFLQHHHSDDHHQRLSCG